MLKRLLTRSFSARAARACTALRSLNQRLAALIQLGASCPGKKAPSQSPLPQARLHAAQEPTMKRIAPLICLSAGLLLASSGPALADPPLGGSRDRHGDYRDQPDRRDGNRSPDRGGRDGRNSGERRPLGTSHDDYRWRRDDDRRRPPRDRYERDQYNQNRYRNDRYDSSDRDARRAAEAVRRDERGRVLSSQPADDRGYRVRVLTPDGYVRERYVDPRDADRKD
jgi:hypothetical protein